MKARPIRFGPAAALGAVGELLDRERTAVVVANGAGQRGRGRRRVVDADEEREALVGLVRGVADHRNGNEDRPGRPGGERERAGARLVVGARHRGEIAGRVAHEDGLHARRRERERERRVRRAGVPLEHLGLRDRQDRTVVVEDRPGALRVAERRVHGRGQVDRERLVLLVDASRARTRTESGRCSDARREGQDARRRRVVRGCGRGAVLRRERDADRLAARRRERHGDRGRRPGRTSPRRSPQSVTETCGGASSSTIVAVAVAVPIVAFTGLESARRERLVLLVGVVRDQRDRDRCCDRARRERDGAGDGRVVGRRRGGARDRRVGDGDRLRDRLRQRDGEHGRRRRARPLRDGRAGDVDDGRQLVRARIARARRTRHAALVRRRRRATGS